MFVIYLLDRLLAGRLLVPDDVIHQVVNVSALTWFI
jgi:hypothetical protein